MKRYRSFGKVCITGGLTIALCAFLFLWSVTPLRSAEHRVEKVPETTLITIDELLAFNIEQQGQDAISIQGVKPFIDFIVQEKPCCYELPKRRSSNGAGIRFTVKSDLQRILSYSYNREIPQSTIKPAAVYYSFWTEVQGYPEGLPDLWTSFGTEEKPKVIRGVQRESTTPDLHTGAYYEYDLQRTFILYENEKRRVFISLSDQRGPSTVGKIGYILGKDSDLNYVYSQKEGINKFGLGWVKSRISTFFSVMIFVENKERPGQVEVASFQWLSAGWKGINMVRDHHITRGLKRFATSFSQVMEGDFLPPKQRLEQVFRNLAQSDTIILKAKMEMVVEKLIEDAQSDPKLVKSKAYKTLVQPSYVDTMTREALQDSLMKEYIKEYMGKGPELGKEFWAFLTDGSSQQSM